MKNKLLVAGGACLKPFIIFCSTLAALAGGISSPGLAAPVEKLSDGIRVAVGDAFLTVQPPGTPSGYLPSPPNSRPIGYRGGTVAIKF